MVGTAVVAALAAAVASIAANAATGSGAAWFPTMDGYYLWWLAGATLAVAGSALLVWWVQRWHDNAVEALGPAPVEPESWMVDRPDELARISRALLGPRPSATVGITAAVRGAGGFGKTTVARLVSADPNIRRHFRDQVFWVTLGQDLTRTEGLVQKVNDLIQLIDPARAHPFTDVQQAAQRLSAVLAGGPRRLLVLDDVWHPEQLAAFPVTGHCVRLVTTRIPSLVAGQGESIEVGQMSDEQARRVLLADLLQAPPAAVVAGLLTQTGRWPLLLRLVNRILLDQTRSGADAGTAAREVLLRLRRDGALHVDALLDTGRPLDVNDPGQRERAVAATIEASTGLLTEDQRARFGELAVFADGGTVPIALATTLWRSTGELDNVATRALCARLADLALVTVPGVENATMVELHDVVRDFVRDGLDESTVRRLHGVLLDAVAARLPRVRAQMALLRKVVAWWRLPESEEYLRGRLVRYLVAADRRGDAEAIATELRWVQARWTDVDVLGPFNDLVLAGSPRTRRLSRLYALTAHLLTPTQPPHSRLDILYDRVAHDDYWGPAARDLSRTRAVPRLTSGWPLPDLPDRALLRALIGHAGNVHAIGVTVDGALLATGGSDGTVRVWQAGTGWQRAVWTAHAGGVRALAIAPDGTWLATAGADGTARTWDAETGQHRIDLDEPGVRTLAIAPDGAWLATGGRNGAVCLWDAATGQRRATCEGHTGAVNAVAVAADSKWLATTGDDGTARLWDAATGRRRATCEGHTGAVNAVAVAADGKWLATGGNDGTVRLWDTTGRQQGQLDAHRKGVHGVAIAPDGSWLATTGGPSKVYIWDVTNRRRRAPVDRALPGPRPVAVAPDGSWLATASGRGTVRIWDVTADRSSGTSNARTELVRGLAVAPNGRWLAAVGTGRLGFHHSANGRPRRRRRDADGGHESAVAIGPDGRWLVVGEDDGTVRIRDASGRPRSSFKGHPGVVNAVAIAPDGKLFATAAADGARTWDAATGRRLVAVPGHPGGVTAVAIAPDGSWLATAGADGSARIWDAATGQRRAVLVGHAGRVHAVAIAPDGSWLATAGADRTIRTWRVATGSPQLVLIGHTGAVRAVAIAPSGRWLATTGFDLSVRVWDTRDGGPVAMTRFESNGACCAWAPDGTALFAGGSHGLYRFDFRDPPTG